jgi:hypothetical protein
MKRQLLTLFAMVALLAGLFGSTAAPVLAVGGGSFWLTDGANGTGDAIGFDILPERIINFPGLRYNSNCGASCGLVDNTVSSVVFSCGVAGFPIDQSDWIKHFSATGGIGGYQLLDPNYPAACSNGRIIMNTGNYPGSSLITNE